MDFQPILDFLTEYGFEIMIGIVLVVCNLFGFKIKPKIKQKTITEEEKKKLIAKRAKQAEKYTAKAQKAVDELEKLEKEI